MSELIELETNNLQIRHRLLTAASAVVLTAAMFTNARADYEGRPTVWIDLGGQLDKVDAGEARLSPPFFSQIDSTTFTSPTKIQQPARYANGVEGAISIQPEQSDWSFSAGLRYGRANNQKNIHEELQPPSAHVTYEVPRFGINYHGTVLASGKSFVTTVSRHEESYAVLDFRAGKDVGLGVGGPLTSLSVNFGVRFAQFTSKAVTSIQANPNYHFAYYYKNHYGPYPANIKLPGPEWSVYGFNGVVSRSFQGIGPSVGWDLSSTLLKIGEDSSLDFDGGMGLAVLFGRQKTRGHHDTSKATGHRTFFQPTAVTASAYHHAYNIDRSHSVVSPNLGGYAGLSIKFPNAKVSLGYRADFFFDALDGGMDTHKSTTVGFHGPYAAISIGLGG